MDWMHNMPRQKVLDGACPKPVRQRGQEIFFVGCQQVPDLLIRSLDVLNKWDVKFNRDKDEPILMAFAVWDGASRDYDGRKSVAMWQRLYLPKQ